MMLECNEATAADEAAVDELDNVSESLMQVPPNEVSAARPETTTLPLTDRLSTVSESYAPVDRPVRVGVLRDRYMIHC